MLALVVLLMVLILGAALVLGARQSQLHRIVEAISHGDLKVLRSQLNALGAWAVLVLVALVLAHTVLPFPAELVSAAGGFALGFAVALPVLAVSLLASALIAYFIGARVGRPLAAALIGHERLRTGERLVERGGAQGLLAVRLCPLMPFSPVCLACGLTCVPLRRYVWTTTLGMLPELTLVTFLGAQLQSPRITDPAIWAPVAGLLILVLLGPRLMRRTQAGADEHGA